MKAWTESCLAAIAAQSKVMQDASRVEHLRDQVEVARRALAAAKDALACEIEAQEAALPK